MEEDIASILATLCGELPPDRMASVYLAMVAAVRQNGVSSQESRGWCVHWSRVGP
jgi:hypothetical protein